MAAVGSNRREGATGLTAHLSNTGNPVKLQGSLRVRVLQLRAEPECVALLFLFSPTASSRVEGLGKGQSYKLEPGSV